MSKIAKVRDRKRTALDQKKKRQVEAEKEQKDAQKPVARNTHLLGTKIGEAQKAKQARLVRENEQIPLREKFSRDLDTLHGLSLEDRATRKMELIEKYREHCEAFAKAAKEVQDAIFQHWVVWLFDAGLYNRKYLDEFLEQVKIAIQLKQKPGFMKSTFPEFLHWSVLKWAEEEYSEKRSPDPWFSKVCEEVKDWSKIQHQLSRRMLTLWFKLLQDAGDFKKAAEVGKIAIKYKAKIKGRYNEVLNQLD